MHAMAHTLSVVHRVHSAHDVHPTLESGVQCTPDIAEQHMTAEYDGMG